MAAVALDVYDFSSGPLSALELADIQPGPFDLGHESNRLSLNEFSSARRQRAAIFILARRLLSKSFQVAEDAPILGLDVAAALAALLFAVHPLRVESVAWATERRDVLSGLFFLLTLSFYIRSQDDSETHLRRTWFAMALIAHFFSLTAKATAITMPAVLLLLDIYPMRRISWRWQSWFGFDGRKVLWEKAPFIVLAVLFAIIALFAQQRAGALRPVQQYFFTYRVGQAAYGIIFYLWKSILPLALSPLYELPFDFDVWTPIFVLSGIAAVSITVALFLLRHRWPAGLACWVYYLVLLAPVLGVAQSGPQLVADRYSYLSCMSWAILAAGGFFHLWQSADRRPARRRVLIATSVIVIAVLIGLGEIAIKQTRVWHDTRTLWQHVIAVAPQSSIAYYNLGRMLEDENKPKDALAYYNYALTINPAYADAHYNLARLLAKQGLQVQAIDHYRQSLAIRPNDADAHNNLGLLLALRGEVEPSLEEFQKAVRIDPNYGKAFFNMGRIIARQGKPDEAIQNYRRALQLNPDEVAVLTELGDELARQGQLDEAIVHLTKAVTVKPGLPDAHVALARALAAQGKIMEAEKHYREALRQLKSPKEIQAAQ
jgi:protein O-mannosyl-transferase